MKKIDHVLLFCEKMLDFDRRHPDELPLDALTKIPSAAYATPFHRDARLNNPVVQEMRNRFGKAIMKKMYLVEWEFVKVISYDAVFIEHLNIVDDKYDTLYNILGDDVIYTEFFVPTFIRKFKCQRHLYLKKDEESISGIAPNIPTNDSLE